MIGKGFCKFVQDQKKPSSGAGAARSHIILMKTYPPLEPYLNAAPAPSIPTMTPVFQYE
jgi:hypothetical protein